MDHSKIITIKVCEAYTEEGVQVREQVCQVAKEGDILNIGIRLKPSLNPHLILNTGFMKELIQAAEFNFRNQLKTVCYICL